MAHDSRLLSITVRGSQGRNSGSQCLHNHIPEQRDVSGWILSCLVAVPQQFLHSYTIQGILSRDGATHSGWGFPTSAIKAICHRHVYNPAWSRRSSFETPSPGDSRLRQVQVPYSLSPHWHLSLVFSMIAALTSVRGSLRRVLTSLSMTDKGCSILFRRLLTLCMSLFVFEIGSLYTSFLVFETGSLYVSLAWNSQRLFCLRLPRGGIKGVSHYN